jgi:hypothetical protein
MSTVVSKNVQIGADGTASNNFTIYQPESPDGTLRIGNGNSGTTSAQVVLTSAGNVGIGTSTPLGNLQVYNSGGTTNFTIQSDSAFTGGVFFNNGAANSGAISYNHADDSMLFRTNLAERARIDASGNLMVGMTTAVATNNGSYISPSGFISIGRATDATLMQFASGGTVEGSISVSGTTVSYNGGHLARWAQTTTVKDESLVKGTVLSNLDEMNVYTDAEGNPVENEQLNKVKVSDVEGDANVAGVFVNWEHDEAHNVDEINMAMTGDMIIRIAQGVTVARGDLLMSAGDGTAKPQGDDIVRSKTVAKVTSTHVTCTYADGSFCVPCVLMAC